MDFEDFKSLDMQERVEILQTTKLEATTPLWFERLQTAYKTNSPWILQPWEELIEQYYILKDEL